jgi:hypothetical protein
MVGVDSRKDKSGRIVVSFPYDPYIATKIKVIEGRFLASGELGPPK